MSKNYFEDLPENEKEVSECFDTIYSKGIALEMKSIYNVKRKMGIGHIEAYEQTLLIHIDICKDKK
jgi:hypothetical protein